MFSLKRGSLLNMRFSLHPIWLLGIWVPFLLIRNGIIQLLLPPSLGITFQDPFSLIVRITLYLAPRLPSKIAFSPPSMMILLPPNISTCMWAPMFFTEPYNTLHALLYVSNIHWYVMRGWDQSFYQDVPFLSSPNRITSHRLILGSQTSHAYYTFSIVSWLSAS